MPQRHQICRTTLLESAAVLVLLLCSADLLAGQEAALQASKQFAAKPHPCGMDHGYQCRHAIESDFIGLQADAEMVPGNYLAAWQLAFADFVLIDDLSDDEKQLQHYKMGFSENSRQYVVHFQALLLPAIKNGKPEGILRGTLGRTTRYWINKSTLAIEKRLFYK